MEDIFKRIDKSKIAPFFLKKCELLIANCKAAGVDYVPISGYRDPEEQAKLYAIGRTVDIGKPVVTKAEPYKSFHNYGLAMDFCKDDDPSPKVKPNWSIDQYTVLADEANKLGLSAGLRWYGNFQEGPHIQVPFCYKLDELKAIMLSQGIEAVWDAYIKRLRGLGGYKNDWI